MSGRTAKHDYQKMAHLLRRAGFGASRDEVEAALRKGFDTTLRELVHYDTALPPNDFERVQDRLQSDFLDFRNFGDLQLWWLHKMAHTDRPLQEKMTLFWHGHFATAYSKVKAPELMFRQNQLLRKHALGNFKTLALAVSQDPAMILYLDNQTNRKGRANENYARELFELFTLGIGHYTEQDIKEAARAFTGWTFNRATGEFFFARRLHDYGPKTVFGKTGNWNGDDIVEMAVTHPASAPFICKKLFQFFIHDEPRPADIKPFADLYTRSGYELKPLLEAMFRAPVFNSEKAMWAKIKSPVEFVVGAIRTTQAEMPARFAPVALKAMGQELFNPPNVKGWDGGADWINTTTLLTRFNFAMRLASLNEDNQPLLQDIRSLITQRQLRAAEDVVDYFTERILHRAVTPQTRRTLLAYLHTGPSGTPQIFDLNAVQNQRDMVRKIHGLMHVIMLTPEYQLV